MSPEIKTQLGASACLLFGFAVGWLAHGAPAPERPPVVEYLQGDPRSQVTINSRLETLLEADQESIHQFELELDKQHGRLEDLKKGLSERDTRIDELELRVRGMQMGLEMQRRKDAGR